MQNQETSAPSVDGLIAKLEEAERGSRQLDWAIHGAPAPPTPAYDWSNVPAYTTSLDAALTLVPEGHRWLLDKRPYGDQRNDGYRAEVYRQGHHYLSDRSDVPQHWGPSAPLALCIAALKATAASPPTEPASDRTTSNTEDHK